MNNNVYVVVEGNAEQGIETFIYSNKQAAMDSFNEIVTEYKDLIGELGDATEISDTWAYLVDKHDCEVARVFWQEKTVK